MMRRKLNFGHETMISPLGIPFKNTAFSSFKFKRFHFYSKSGIKMEYEEYGILNWEIRTSMMMYCIDCTVLKSQIRQKLK